MNKRYKWISIISISLVLVLSFYNLKSIENDTKIVDSEVSMSIRIKSYFFPAIIFPSLILPAIYEFYSKYIGCFV